MRSSDHGRQEILDAAEGLFVRYGFKKTSIDDVARTARIGKGSVYLHFSSKEEIFAEVVRRVSSRMLETLVAAVKRARSPVGKLRAFVEAKLTSVAELAAEYHLGEETVLELLPLANSLREAHLAQEKSLLEHVLRDGVASGALTLEHPDLVATGIMATLGALEATMAVHTRQVADVRAGLDELLSVLLRGLNSGPSSRTT